jgi:uncharacterized protein (DUF302 family)
MDEVAARDSGVHGMTRRGMEGLTTIPSNFAPKETMDRLEAEISVRGISVFARIDHAAGAVEAGLVLRPTELLIFGNSRAGTPLMQSVQTIGIELPLKVLVWQDAAGKTWLSYNEPMWWRSTTARAPKQIKRLVRWLLCSGLL